MKPFQLLVCLALACFCCAQNNGCSVNKSIQQPITGLNGPELVNAIVRILECSGDFEDDKMFMRRLAYVGTRDGAEGQGSTGIWGVTEKHLGYMDFGLLGQREDLSNLTDQMCNKYGIYMRRALRKEEKLNLRDPLVSGVVARFYLHYVTVERGIQIPSAEDVNEQATFWFSQFRMNDGSATPQHFTRRVTELKGQRIIV